MRRSGPTARLMAAIAIALLASACGGGGGDGGTIPGPLTATFLPADSTPPAESMSLQAGSRTGDVVNVLVSATGVSDFFGAAFRITYNSNLVQFQAFDSSGSFLPATGVTVDFRVDASTPGNLIVVATRRQNTAGDLPGVDVVGTRTLLSLRFKALGATAGTPVGFGDPKEVRDGQDAELPVSWGLPGSISAAN